MKIRFFLLFSFVLNFSIAQQPNIVTERPFASASSSTIPTKTIQLETGFEYAQSKAGRVESEYISYNSSLLRFGLLENFELRLGIGYNSEKVKSDIKPVDVTGWTPLTLGTKIFVTKEKGWRPEISFIGNLTLPFTGSEYFQPEKVKPDFRFAFTHTFGDHFVLAYNLGLEWPHVANDDVLGVYTVIVGYIITDRLSCFIENYGFVDSEYSIDAGFIYLLKHNFQLDLYGGFGLNSGSPDEFIGLGFSWRIPR